MVITSGVGAGAGAGAGAGFAQPPIINPVDNTKTKHRNITLFFIRLISLYD